MASNDLKSSLSQLEDLLEEYLVKKAPSLPNDVKEFIVKFGPWITLVILIISLPAILFVLGIGAIFSPFAFLGGASTGVSYMLAMIVLAATVILEAVAIPKLLRRERAGWNLVFYASLLGFVSSILKGDIVGTIIGTLISMYILFQVKSYYK